MVEYALYYVHSDVDENNVANTFEDRDEAISYAQEMGDCWVDEVLYGEGDVVISEETIWTYADEQ